MKTKMIFVLAMLCFLASIASGGTPGFDPADGVSAQDMMPDYADITNPQGYDSYDDREEIAAPMPGELRFPDEVEAVCYPDLPSPQLALTGSEDYSTADGEFTRYDLSIANWEDYPDALFQPAPDLPPCGSNANSARSWVDIYDGSDSYLYGFCALTSPADLGNLWFAVRRGETSPRSAYVILKDRKCGSSYRSNTVPISALGTPETPGSPGSPESPDITSTLSAPVQVSPASGSTFDHYPRSTTFQWSPVAGAATYTLEVDCYHCCANDRWCTDIGSIWHVIPGIAGTSYTFNFVGKQPGRWRVWAVKATGEEGPKSEWWNFEYTL